MKQFCCQQMTEALNHQCSQHSDPFDCADALIHYSPKLDEYGLIIHDGGSSVITISHCPWSGTKLPTSKRDLWFGDLAALGFDNPSEQDVLKRVLTEE